MQFVSLQWLLYSMACASEPGSLVEALAVKTEPLQSKQFKVPSLRCNLQWKSVSSDGALRPVEGEVLGMPSSFQINTVDIDYMGTVVGFSAGDALGAYQLRHVPALPDVEAVTGIKSIEQSRLRLGKPTVEHHPQALDGKTMQEVKWGFIHVASDGRLNLMVIRIRFDADGAVLKKWIARDSNEEVTSEGSRESSRRIPDAQQDGGGQPATRSESK